MSDLRSEREREPRNAAERLAVVRQWVATDDDRVTFNLLYMKTVLAALDKAQDEALQDALALESAEIALKRVVASAEGCPISADHCTCDDPEYHCPVNIAFQRFKLLADRNAKVSATGGSPEGPSSDPTPPLLLDEVQRIRGRRAEPSGASNAQPWTRALRDLEAAHIQIHGVPLGDGCGLCDAYALVLDEAGWFDRQSPASGAPIAAPMAAEAAGASNALPQSIRGLIPDALGPKHFLCFVCHEVATTPTVVCRSHVSIEEHS